MTADLHIDAARRSELVAGQAPYALVLSCADSRVPPHTLVERGKLQIVGAFYELSTGRVSFSTVVAGRPAPAQTRRVPAGGHPAPNVVTVRPQPVAQPVAPAAAPPHAAPPPH